MVTRLTRIAPIQLAIVLAILYALVGVIVALLTAPMMAIMATMGGRANFPGFSFGVAGLIFFPIGYGILGFISGLVTAAIYNIVAGWTGGVELTLSNVASLPPEAGTIV